MARGADGRDYFVEELAVCDITGDKDLVPVLVSRWYQKEGGLWATVLPVGLNHNKSAYIFDGREGKSWTIPLSSFCMNTLDLENDMVRDSLVVPSPEHVEGVSANLGLNRTSAD